MPRLQLALLLVLGFCGLPVEADVGPAQVIRQEEQDVGFLLAQCCSHAQRLERAASQEFLEAYWCIYVRVRVDKEQTGSVGRSKPFQIQLQGAATR